VPSRGRRKQNREPLVLTLDHLVPKGVGGVDQTGRTWRVRTAPVGAVVSAWPGRKGSARRLEILSPAPDQVQPQCPVFGLCGGCQLQEMPLDSQRHHKQKMVEKLLDHPSAPIRGAGAGFGYRNKVELSFGTQRYLPESEKDGERDGDFLGFHPPGWFSRIVPVNRCAIASDRINTVIEAVQSALPAPAWSTVEHTGAWRHLVIRDGEELLVSLVTSSAAEEEQVRAVGQRLAALDGVGGVLWICTDRVSDVAQGEVREVLHGSTEITMRAGAIDMKLPHDAFFQVNTAGTAVLFDTIREALGPDTAPTLLDLYCGVGAIGLALADGYREVIGIELVESAIICARENAQRMGVQSEWHAGKVEEVLPTLNPGGPRHVVVDPPRAGLHPKSAAFIAQIEAEVLVYVACSPAALSRDRALLAEGGWRLDGLWTVDLFPQTLHVEAVARFVR
jgi:23S rRNA (uracil1939-C5)-methyltransferase